MIKKFAKKLIKAFSVPFVFSDFLKFKSKDTTARFRITFGDFNPQIRDKTAGTSFDRHYVYHTAWAARKVKEINPALHIDIASSLYFCALVSAFVPIDFYDYRPAALSLSNLKSKRGDLHALPFPDNSVVSLSCMHTIEHIGLGRYGDPIDPEGDIKAIKELKRVLAPRGSLLFVVPMGNTDRIEWNAHRIYTYGAVMKLMEGLILKEFSLIPQFESGGPMVMDADPSLLKDEACACGCFWFTKE